MLCCRIRAYQSFYYKLSFAQYRHQRAVQFPFLRYARLQLYQRAPAKAGESIQHCSQSGEVGRRQRQKLSSLRPVKEWYEKISLCHQTNIEVFDVSKSTTA